MPIVTALVSLLYEFWRPGKARFACKLGPLLHSYINGYANFSSVVWSPPNPAGDLEPYPITEPGTYGITVTDAMGCTTSDQVTQSIAISLPGTYTVTVSGASLTELHFNLLPPLCNGTPGMLTVDQVNGGIGPFAYSLDGGQTFFADLDTDEWADFCQPGFQAE